MKKLLLLLLCVPLIGLGQTLIPDANFEQALINLGYDTGTPNGSVPTANINTITNLNVNNKDIGDLTGIEDFTLLTDLSCRSNELTSLDLSNNTSLENLVCEQNQLTSLDVSNSPALTDLNCHSNQLTSLDVSNNPALTDLMCHYNDELINLDVRNGNNTNLSLFLTYSNPNLYCINVDDPSWSTANWIDIDPHHYFSNNCPPPTSIEEHTTNKEFLKTTDILGREVNEKRNTPLFYIYNDGTVEKKIIIE